MTPAEGLFQFLAQERVGWGTPAPEAVAREMAALGARRALIVASTTLATRTDTIAAIEAELGDGLAGLFTGCREHTPVDTVIDCAAAIRRSGADVVVTVGGGTPIDTVKAALLCLAEDVHDPEALKGYRVTVAEDGARTVPAVGPSAVRQIAVPTTLSGAEFSNIAGVTDPERGIKDAYIARDSAPAAVILDPAAAVHTPDWLWLSTGVRAVDHAVETLCSRSAQPLPDATAIHALRMFAGALPRTKEKPDDLAARRDCQIAVWLAGFGLGRVEYGASHGIGHQLGAVGGVPHGHTSCVMLPSVLRWNAPVNAGQQARVSEALGRAGEAAADAVADLVARLGQPGTLRAVGIAENQLDTIAEGSLGNMMVRSNPRPIDSAAQVREILDMAW
ncbi:MAG: iron-containing alcohol dehydrogenase [Rhodospirillaceae bacterium]|nr:iron-containing alcohol dehydrogenase [Rhodospirillaceae bacterium]MYF86990.1 iron-containing alcohol dehydrogenase [Rhodospirillaceae bacterium]MYH38333.1 iron-containing alcohol dehydrogenase [Rhodospirillaceae bacterium]MYK12841.1 iron-containing alcohol dehydrogenase [Rhodospirillaceae bacterium]MYK59391.1 iron-containing alcohol dehydrogenase [Rhodospirillaceae bacterium]